jgi:hypothetical protein
VELCQLSAHVNASLPDLLLFGDHRLLLLLFVPVDAH